MIVLLRGWGDFSAYKFKFPLIARRCNRAGLNAATLVAPYHFQRRPRQHGTYDNLDCLQWATTTAQALAEIHALTGWLLGEGCPAVALWGYSLGAWYAGMAACRDARLAAVVLVSPPVRRRPSVEQRALRPRIRARFQSVRELCEGLNLTAMNLAITQPAIPKGNILLIVGTHDLICLKDDAEDLWRLWGQPDIWRLPHGHVGVCCGFVPGLPGRVLGWLASRLDKPLVHQSMQSPNPSLQPTPGSVGSSSARFTSLGPAWLSLGRWRPRTRYVVIH